MSKPKLASAGDWTIEEVLVEGDDASYGSNSLALGTWAGEYRLACRWDRSATSEAGYPDARGHQRWFFLPEWMELAVLASASLPADVRRLAIARLASREASTAESAIPRTGDPATSERRKAREDLIAHLRSVKPMNIPITWTRNDVYDDDF